MNVSIGRIVLYTLTQDDAQKINRRRTSGGEIANRIKAGTWPIGAQAHIGDEVYAGDIFPMLVVKVDTARPDCASGRVFLDGSDEFHVSGAPFTAAEAGLPLEGFWHWPPGV